MPTSKYLPPANEVWGKVIFLHVCVILSMEGAVCVVAGGLAWLWGGCVVVGGHVWLLVGVRRIRRDTVNEQEVCILLEYILVKYVCSR